jgi:hypothetical protein
LVSLPAPHALPVCTGTALPCPALPCAPCLAPSDGQVPYGAFLDRYRIVLGGAEDWQGEVVELIARRLFERAGSLEEAYKLFDADKDGLLDVRVGNGREPVCLPPWVQCPLSMRKRFSGRQLHAAVVVRA